MRPSEARYVAQLEISRCFGGREEGGWWYDHTDVTRVWRVPTKRAARRLKRRMERADAPYTPRHNRYSVLGGADTEYVVLRTMAEAMGLQTRGRPHYC